MYDVIVIGVGSMGSSTLYQLAKQGIKVLGIEQFGVGHERGSHSGVTRIVRKAYFEHPDYVPLLERAYKGWDAIQNEAGKNLFYKSGLLYLGEKNHPVIKGIKESAKLYNIDLRLAERNQTKAFLIPDKFEQIFEPDAGFALAEETIKTYTEEALKHGAELKKGEQVIGWELKNEVIEVRTNRSTYRTEKLILSAGAFLKELVPQLAPKLKVTRQLIAWIKPEVSQVFKMDNFSSWVIADKSYPGIMYGFPMLSKSKIGGSGLLKIAHHTPGELINPEELERYDSKDEQIKILSFIEKYIPKAVGEMVSLSVCLYTNSPDDHFILDFLPDTNNQVIIASGFSGHGFKFVPVIGELLCDLVIHEKSETAIRFLSLDRFKSS